MRFRSRLTFASLFVTAAIAGTVALSTETSSAQAARRAAATVDGVSPALCGPGDKPEPGIQGDVPAGLKTWAYNCGVRRVGQLPRVGSVQGYGHCAYVRERDRVYVIDVRNPARPAEVGSIPVKYASETMRVAVAADRAVLVSGSSVYDISDCLHPKLKGEIEWPPLRIGDAAPLGGGGGRGLLPHDLRVGRDATKVYGSQGLWQVDISNLEDPKTWTVKDFRCEIASQVPGPSQELHRETLKRGLSLCDDYARPGPDQWRFAATGTQAAAIWGQLSHGIDTSADSERVYIADQAASIIGKLNDDVPKLVVVDVRQSPVKVLGVTSGAGHSVDWFATRGGEYVLHANEVGTGPLGGPAVPSAIASMARAAVNIPSDTCRPYPRPMGLGWAFDAMITDVSDPTKPRNLSRLEIAINNPEHCEARKASGHDPSVAYHMIDNAPDARFAAVNFGSAGLRIFDIRDPARPYEIAYFNHGPMVHGGVGYYDAARGLIYAAGGTGFWVLELEPQVRARLRLTRSRR
jgi:hypothetical protein